MPTEPAGPGFPSHPWRKVAECAETESWEQVGERGSIPGGYVVARTEEPVSVLGRRYFKRRAEKLAEEHPPLIPSYHLRIEKVGRWLYEVVAYQNKLIKDTEPPAADDYSILEFRERKVLELRDEGVDPTRIGGQFGITPARVDVIEKQARQRLEEAHGGD